MADLLWLQKRVADLRKIFDRGSVSMIEIPIGKALAAQEKEAGALSCADCHLCNVAHCFEKFACRSDSRKDGRDVVFMLVDINKDTGGVQ